MAARGFRIGVLGLLTAAVALVAVVLGSGVLIGVVSVTTGPSPSAAPSRLGGVGGPFGSDESPSAPPHLSGLRSPEPSAPFAGTPSPSASFPGYPPTSTPELPPTPSPDASYPALQARWDRIPKAPIAGRAGHTAVWTGEEMIVWGGDAFSDGEGFDAADGAAYVASSRHWRQVARAPLAGRSGHTAVWTGQEMIVWGGSAPHDHSQTFADGAAYVPATDRWRVISSEPSIVGRFAHEAVWTGREMIIWGGHAAAFGAEESDLEGAAYDPATDRWRTLSPSPLPPRAAGTAVWTGTEFVVVAYPLGVRSTAVVAAYNPISESWRSGPRSPLAALAAPDAVWTGAEVLLLTARRGPYETPAGMLLAPSAAFDPAEGRWRVPAFGPGGQVTGEQPAWTGSAVLLSGPRGAAYDPESNRWQRVPAEDGLRREGYTAVWTGRALLVWGGAAGESITREADGFRLTLGR